MTTLREAWHRDGEHDRETAEAHAATDDPMDAAIARLKKSAVVYAAAFERRHSLKEAFERAEQKLREAEQEHSAAQDALIRAARGEG